MKSYHSDVAVPKWNILVRAERDDVAEIYCGARVALRERSMSTVALGFIPEPLTVPVAKVSFHPDVYPSAQWHRQLSARSKVRSRKLG